MMLRHSIRPVFSIVTAALLSLAMLGCGQVNSGSWYDSDKDKSAKTKTAKPIDAAKKTASNAGARLAGIWDRVTTAIDRRPQSQRGLERSSKTQNRSTKSSGQIEVQKGDSYFSLAQRHKVPLNALLKANGARPPYALSAGDRLVLPQQAFYKVKSKDTLYSISRKFKTDAASLAKLNGIAAPYAISVGQMLQTPVSSSQTKPTNIVKAKQSQLSKVAKAKKPTRLAAAPRRVGRFRVPVKGPVISDYGPKQGGLHNDGINIAARAGTPIVAAENGVVVYAGNELRGYGNLLLIRHSDGWVTAYAHASKFNVKPGDRVRQGDKVAEVGQTGNVDRPQLHFELRKGTRAVNPKSLI